MTQQRAWKSLVLLGGLGLLGVLVVVETTTVQPSAPELDLMTEHSTLRQLEDVASDVVLVEPTGAQRTEEMHGASFVVTQVDVVASGAGPLSAGDVVEIRQEGDRWVNVAPALEPGPGTRYVVYLRPWRVLDDEDTGQHVVAGGQAVWRAQDADGELVTTKSPLPRHVEISGRGDELTVTS
ncbi:hypothetical protein [Cellulosimicrobium sp. Marseille-Q4280]|uniref:hypothetical protein n=1 Tax=Cellulosimicrobium sp. Marseille-Q4280 TaxID=2937992 RepID=UPI00203E3568|nr:hypothetical protein [Cellulosimicrobium sp. Marseille-Q4280]